MKENWGIKKLGEISECFIGITYKPDDVAEEGTIVLRSGNIQNSKLDLSNDIVRVKNVIPQKQIVRKNDILMCSRNGSLHLVGKCALIPDTNEKMTFGAFMTIIRSQFSSFLFHFFNSIFFREQLNTAQTTTVNQITLSKLTNIKIPIPPLPVQETIVKELDILHRLKELQEQQLAEYDNLAQSTFYSMFGDPIENEKGWEVRKLGEVCDTTSGGTPSSKRTEYYDNGTINWLRSGEVNKIFITESELKITEEGLNNSSAKMLPINTVLIAMYGATVGQVGILKFEASTNQAICGILPNDYLNPVFLYFTLFFHKPYYLELAMGGAQPNISQTIIKNTNVIFPPLSFQTDFANRIEKIETQKELVKQGIAETQLLIDYTMDKYFG